MKVWLKRIAQTLIFALLLGFVINHIYGILSWKDTAGEYYSSMDSFYELKEDLVDVLFLGSSHCYCSINNSILWEEEGISSFSLAISGQDLASTYHCFKEALSTQTPDVVAVDVYGVIFEGYQVEGNLYRNTLPYQLSKNAYDAVVSMVEEEKRGDFLLRWPIVHTRYAELKEQDFTKQPAYIGYHAEFNTQAIGNIVPYTGSETAPVVGNGEEWLIKIIQLAEESDTDLLFFIAPYAASEGDQKIYNRVAEIAQAHEVPLLNMIQLADELKLDGNTDFIDWMHTNYYGAKKVTEYMCQYLKTNYALEDHRGDVRYGLWDEDLRYRQNEWYSQYIKRDTTCKDYLNTLCEVGGYTIVVTTSGEYLNGDVNLNRQLKGLGIGEEFYTGKRTWVFSDGELIYESDRENDWAFVELNGGELILSAADGVRSVQLDGQECCKVTDGINVMVYDNLQGKLVDAVGFVAAAEYGLAR